MKSRILKLSLIFTLLLGSHTSWAEGQIQSSNEFISVADIHFNPFASCKVSLRTCKIVAELRAADYQQWDGIFKKYDDGVLAKSGEDTNYRLFKLMITELKQLKQEGRPEFGLLLGDFLAHNFRRQYLEFAHDPSARGYAQFVQKTLQFMTSQLHQVFDDVDLYPVVGNNDSYTGDYSVVPQGKFFQNTAVTWSTLISDKTNRSSLLSTFPTAGYYSVQLPEKKLRIVLLDTVLFSTNTSRRNADAARQQLKWLDAELNSASQQKQFVVLAFHIPMGIDVIKTIRNRFGSITQFWRDEYTQKFEEEIRKFPGIIKLILPAHIHMDSFQLIAANQIANIPVIFTPSISPNFGNHPGFKVFHYDPQNFELDDYETYFLSLAQAQVEKTN